MTIHSQHSRERGFTIIELMIATLIFSVILTVITMGVMSFTNNYYRGVNNSTTQNTTRTILDTISQAIQFGSAPVYLPIPVNNYFCAGGYSFTYDKGVLYTETSQMGLYMAPMGALCSATTIPPTGGTQLLGKNLRLTNLEVKSVGVNLYSVTVSIAMGPYDLLCSPSLYPAGCNGSPTVFWSTANDVTCRSTVGSQLCATSTLTTVVEKRI